MYERETERETARDGEMKNESVCENMHSFILMMVHALNPFFCRSLYLLICFKESMLGSI